MTTSSAIFIGRCRGAAIALALGSAGCASVSSQSVPDERFSGVLQVVLGHSSFRAANGEFYSVRIEGDEARNLIASRVRESNKSEPLCLTLAFAGQLLEEEDLVGRKIVALKTLDHIARVACP